MFFTLICCAFTALIGLTNKLVLGLLFFAIANFCYQTAVIFYNALLPQISGKGQIGKSASIIGPLIWGLCAWAFGFLGILRYRLAILSLLLFLGLGFIILQKIPNSIQGEGFLTR